MPVKRYLVALLFAAASHLGFAADADVTRHSGDFICYNGKPGSSGFCKTNLKVKGKLTCGIVGKVSEITWSFVGRRDGKDVYDFSRRFPLESESIETQTRQVEFAGDRVIIFEDKDQTIVLQSKKP